MFNIICPSLYHSDFNSCTVDSKGIYEFIQRGYALTHPEQSRTDHFNMSNRASISDKSAPPHHNRLVSHMIGTLPNVQFDVAAIHSCLYCVSELRTVPC